MKGLLWKGCAVVIRDWTNTLRMFLSVTLKGAWPRAVDRKCVLVRPVIILKLMDVLVKKPAVVSFLGRGVFTPCYPRVQGNKHRYSMCSTMRAALTDSGSMGSVQL